MTKIDFYILSDQLIEQRYLFACRLAEKAYKLGNNVYVHCQTADQANQLDQLAWSFRNDCFIPHNDTALNQTTSVNISPVQIGFQHCPDSFNQVMINLSDHIPDFFSRFERVSEIVVQDTAITTATRNNYKFYRHRGYPLTNHDLRNS